MPHFPINGGKFHEQTSVIFFFFFFPLSQNQKLYIENRVLREKTSGLQAENEELRQRLCLDTFDSKEKVKL